MGAPEHAVAATSHNHYADMSVSDIAATARQLSARRPLMAGKAVGA